MPRPLTSALALTAIVILAAPAPAIGSTPPYRPPVDAPLTDTFRPPATPYGAGNRGVDYATTPGTTVHAAADGVVTFAGQVGGSLHVTVLHDDGVRTTASFLAGVQVHRGDRVRQGDLLGTAGERLHFGARVGDQYIDPLALFAQPRPRARLVPDDGKGLPGEAEERGAIERLLRGLAAGGRVAKSAVAWAGGLAAQRALDPDLAALSKVLSLAGTTRLAAALALATWVERRGGCTSEATPPPSTVPDRRIAVLVGGLGSSSGHAAVLDVDTAGLGYAKRVQFSYRGGTTENTSYGPADTENSIAESGARLRALLHRLAAEHPDVRIDVIAHSLGGLVAREALSGPAGVRPPSVAHLVTLGTPHQGAPLAGVAAQATDGALGAALSTGVAGRIAGLDPGGPAPDTLRPGSPSAPGRVAAGLRVTSIAARADWVVPVTRSWLPNAANVVVGVSGATAHDALPGSKAAHREIALAVNDRAPTCRGLVDAVADVAAGVAVEGATSALGDAVRPIG